MNYTEEQRKQIGLTMTDNQRWEIDHNGEFFVGEPQNINIGSKVVLEKLLNKNGWKCTVEKEKGSFFRVNMENDSIDKSENLIIYLGKIGKDEQKNKQIEMYKQAKQTQETFRSAKDKVEISIGIVDKAYFAVQEFLQSRNKKTVKALNPGNIEPRRNIRKELQNKEYTEKTNVVSREYINKESKENKEPVVTEKIMD